MDRVVRAARKCVGGPPEASDPAEYCRRLAKKGHWSPFEAATYSFDIEMSRVALLRLCTATPYLSLWVKSQRYTGVQRPSMWLTRSDNAAWAEGYAQYCEARAAGEAREDARRYTTLGSLCEVHVAANARALWAVVAAFEGMSCDEGLALASKIKAILGPLADMGPREHPVFAPVHFVAHGEGFTMSLATAAQVLRHRGLQLALTLPYSGWRALYRARQDDPCWVEIDGPQWAVDNFVALRTARGAQNDIQGLAARVRKLLL